MKKRPRRSHFNPVLSPAVRWRGDKEEGCIHQSCLMEAFPAYCGVEPLDRRQKMRSRPGGTNSVLASKQFQSDVWIQKGAKKPKKVYKDKKGEHRKGEHREGHESRYTDVSWAVQDSGSWVTGPVQSKFADVVLAVERNLVSGLVYRNQNHLIHQCRSKESLFSYVGLKLLKKKNL